MGCRNEMSKAINMKSKFYAYEKSTEIKNDKIVIITDSKEEKISSFDFIPPDFPRKTIVNIELVDSLNESSACYKTQNEKKISSRKIKIEKNSRIIIKSPEKNIHLDGLISEYGFFELSIYYFIDTPLIAKEAKDSLQPDLIKNAEILSIYIIISKEHGGELKKITGASFYESYGELGFFITDVVKMSEFIEQSDREIDNDLFKEFTTTELASELFEKGIMMLCWGGTPWPYFITSEITSSSRLPLPKGSKTPYSGTYKFLSEIQEASVIPGNALSDWSLCCEKEWPTIKVPGKGDTASIELYALNATSADQTSNSVIPTFFISRKNESDDNDVVSPLLSSSIF